MTHLPKKKWGVALPCGEGRINLITSADDEGEATEQLLAQAREMHDLIHEWIERVDRRSFYCLAEGTELPVMTLDVRARLLGK